MPITGPSRGWVNQFCLDACFTVQLTELNNTVDGNQSCNADLKSKFVRTNKILLLANVVACSSSDMHRSVCSKCHTQSSAAGSCLAPCPLTSAGQSCWPLGLSVRGQAHGKRGPGLAQRCASSCCVQQCTRQRGLWPPGEVRVLGASSARLPAAGMRAAGLAHHGRCEPGPAQRQSPWAW